MKNIGIIGMGYVGLPLAVEFLKSGLIVTGFEIDKKKIEKMSFEDNEEAKILSASFDEQIQELLAEEEQEIEKVKRGDELPAGVLKRVVVYIATKRKLSEGDKLAGRYGIEGYFNHELAGAPGFFEGEKDVGGRWIPVSRRELQPAQDGSAIVLTIDRAIEYVACNKLEETINRYDAAGGSVIIMKIPEGKILAMCNSPSFNPNEYRSVEDIAVFNNPIISAQYEPGSVFKVITMAAALDSGEVTPETTYTDTGEIKVGLHKINNSDRIYIILQRLTTQYFVYYKGWPCQRFKHS